MTQVLQRLDANDRDFARMRGMLWGAGAGLTVPATIVVFTAFLGTADGLGIFLALMGIPALIAGAVTGMVFAWWGAKLLSRGMRVGPIVALSALVAMTATLLVIAAVLSLFWNNWDYFSLLDFFTAVFGFSLFCIPAIPVASYGVWHTLRALVRRNSWQAQSAASSDLDL